MTRRRLSWLVWIALNTVACGRDIPTVCPADLQFKFSPHDTTIAAGEQFMASLAVFGCGGRDRLTDSVTFATSDPSVAVVGNTTGVVTGARPGDAVITATPRHYPFQALIQVHVR